jgi:hypothetical protein
MFHQIVDDGIFQFCGASLVDWPAHESSVNETLVSIIQSPETKFARWNGFAGVVGRQNFKNQTQRAQRSTRLSCGGPELVRYHGQHKKKVYAKSPERGEFKTFETAARDGLFFRFHELIALEGREDQRAVGDINFFILGHRVPPGQKPSFFLLLIGRAEAVP